MGKGEKVVVRFKDGRLVKGYATSFRTDSETVRLREIKARMEHDVPVEELKAVFFVKTFKGYREYAERKAFGIRSSLGCKVFVKLSDRECLLGYIDGELPWDKGFSLAKLGKKTKGFTLVPVDAKSNNNKIFVVGSAIKDISIMAA